MEAVSDGLLARLDELTATLGTVSAEASAQQAALEPAFRAATAGLARDFAFVDGVGVRAERARFVRCSHGTAWPQDSLINMRLAVQKMEATLTAAEAELFRRQRTGPSRRERE